jgi:NAD(P)-dependent dehydrogenase (short-subunit alcohol dehydrogenase family)
MMLKDKVAIVTGGARGIGQEYSLGLVREGAKVVVTDLLSCDETVAKVRQAGGEVLALKTDVISEQSTRAMAEETVQRFGRIDVLVNNAGLFGGLKMTPFEQLDEAEWDRVMAVNVKGLWQCCKAVTPVMRKQGRGKIINISSGTFWGGVPYLLHYVSSKGAVIAFTRALARELSGSGINVNAITPGLTMTEAARGVTDRETFEQVRQQVLDQQIIKRSEEPRDLVGTIVFLASDASDFISGQTINCDGGARHH